MKLFAKLLVAPAALGLLAPISASANELDLGGIENYSSIEEIETEEFSSSTFSNNLTSEVILPSNGISNPYSTLEAGSFSETTVMSAAAQFAVAGASGDLPLGDEEAIHAAYYFDIDLDTSFTGEDNLNVGIEAGNNPDTAVLGSTGLDFGTAGDDTMKVVDVNYTRSFGDLTVQFGDSLDISSQFTGACAYSGFHDTLASCGTGSSAGIEGDVTLTSSYDLGNGFTLGGGISGSEGSTTKGLFTKESADLYAVQVAYAADSYGAAVTYANSDTTSTDTTYWGLNGYYVLGTAIDSVSVGYEFGNPTAGDDTSNWFAGVTTDEVGPGVINLGVGTVGHTTSSANELLLYEVSYGWDINDSMSATLGAFQEERATGSDDLTGVALTTTFSF